MSENPLKVEHDAQHPEFERQDLGAKGVLWFLLGLACFLLVVHFVLTGVYGVLDRYTAEHQPPPNPLITAPRADTRMVAPGDAAKFPQPRLETNETTELNEVREHEEQLLNSYGWVDEKAGVARIPIDRAMQLIAQQGLPTRSQTMQSNPEEAGGGKTRRSPAAK